MEENRTIKKIIRNSIIFFVIVLIIAVIGLIILKYHVEGEQNMPFEISDMLVVSTAEGYQTNQAKNVKWDMELYQTNDVYLTIKKNKNYKKTETIKKVELRNFTIDKKPIVGDISLYLPKGTANTYDYKEKNKLQETITFDGDVKSDIENLKLANQGGTILFRIVNKTGKQYLSNEDVIKQDGTLLKNANLSLEEVRMTISFDLIIQLESDVSFVGKVTLVLPAGDIITQGISSQDKNQIEDVIFKRE